VAAYEQALTNATGANGISPITTKTPMHSTKPVFSKWLLASYLIVNSNSSKGISLVYLPFGQTDRHI
jgi:hypothetical protein